MKKLICLCLLFSFIVTFGSCGQSGNNTISVNAGLAQEDFYANGIGVGFGPMYKENSDFSANSLKHSKLKTNDLPIFKTPYTLTSAGAEFNETEEDKENILAKLKDFANRLGYEINIDEDIQEIDYYFWSNPSSTEEIFASISSVGVEFPSSGLEDNMSVEDCKALLSENKYLKAACEFLKITDAYIEKDVTYDNLGDAKYEYIIFQNSKNEEEFIVNKNFNFIRFVYYSEETDIAFLIAYENIAEKADVKMNFISYDAALSHLLSNDSKDFNGDKLNVKEEDILSCKIKYIDTIADGYLIPCYEFYFNIVSGLEQHESNVNNLKSAGAYYVSAYDVSSLKNAGEN